MLNRPCLAAALASVLACPAIAQPFHDDFSDGNDNGWTRYDLTPVGVSGTWTFPGGAYRLQTAPSPNPAAFGTARLGSVAPAAADVGADFFASVELVNYQRPIGTVHGLSFRLREVGLGTTDGYFLWLATNSTGAITNIIFNRIDNEIATPLGLGSAALAIAPGSTLRLTVKASGDALAGSVYDITNPTVPLATIYVADSTYATGSTGVVLAGLSSPVLTNPTIDGTVDNYYVLPDARCAADLTHGAIPGTPTYGLPSGTLDNEDFFYFLAQFAAGNAHVCDLTTGAVPGQVGYGIPDGVLNNEDFFYYLATFAAGC